MVAPPNPQDCLKIGQVVQFNGQDFTCNVEGTLYGYYPNLGANAFFVSIFVLCFLWQLVCGIRYKTWTYMIALCLGCACEAVGYGGRIMLNNDPLSPPGFKVQITLLIISPAFISAGIYLTLKHIVINFGEEWSRLRPAWYTYIFITCDIISLALQGAGGGIAASAISGSSQQDVGTNLMIAGVVFQVAILTCFGYFLVEYALRTLRRKDRLTSETMTLFHSTGFRAYMAAIVIAYTGIFIRCVYRIPELAGGWRTEIMRNETEFIVLEGVMIIISVLALTVAHPGYCFPVLSNTIGKNKKARKSLEDSDVEMRRDS